MVFTSTPPMIPPSTRGKEAAVKPAPLGSSSERPTTSVTVTVVVAAAFCRPTACWICCGEAWAPEACSCCWAASARCWRPARIWDCSCSPRAVISCAGTVPAAVALRISGGCWASSEKTMAPTVSCRRICCSASSRSAASWKSKTPGRACSRVSSSCWTRSCGPATVMGRSLASWVLVGQVKARTMMVTTTAQISATIPARGQELGAWIRREAAGAAAACSGADMDAPRKE